MLNSTQGYNVKIVANGVILDLFKDEEIKISNNITNLFDIGSIPAEFSRTIMLPGTKKNNAFFEHVYDISVTNPFIFATNQKVQAYLDFNGIYLANGYLQLNKVSVYENKFIDSYEVSLYGIISSFSRDINRLTLNDLTSLSQFNHTSSFNNISSSWNYELFSGSIVYPMADYGTGWQYTAGDLFFGLDDNEGAITIQDYKPAIKIKDVWDAIFETTGYTYSSSFFNQDWVNDVYMICNYGLKYPKYSGVDLETFGQIKVGAISGSGMTDWQPAYNTATQFPWYNVQSDPNSLYGANGAYTLQKGSVIEGTLSLNVNFSASVNVAPAVEIHYWPVGGSPGGAGSGLTTLVNFNQYFERYREANTGGGGINDTQTITTKFNTSYLPAGDYYFGLLYYTNYSPTGGLKFTIDKGSKNTSYLQINKIKNAADGRVIDIPTNMPYGTNGIKLVDWLKGIQKKFNLIIYPDRNNINRIIVETFNNWYNKGQIRDFNKYINLNQKIEVISANNLAVNKLTFGDTLDQDYISQQFSKAANREYGQSYFVDNNNFFSQGEFSVKTTFASEPLVYLQGTGLSGSVGGINPTPTQFLVGELRFGYTNDPVATCTSPAVIETYTLSGEIIPGEIAYRDRYGLTPITGLKYILGYSGGQIYNLNVATGEIGSGTGYYCS